MCSALMRVGLLLVEAGRVGVDVDDVERGHHLVEAEHVVVVGDPPAQQRQVVQQALGDEATVAVQEQVRLRVALGELLVAVPENAWQMGEFRAPGRRHRCASAPGTARSGAGVDGRMSSPRSTWVIFISASSTGLTKVYNGSPLPRVMREVRDGARRERRRPAHQVVPAEVLVGHPQPQHGLAAFGDELRALLHRSGSGRSCHSPAWDSDPPPRGGPRPPLRSEYAS